VNWILLIIAGLFEVAFAACLGKAKETTGITMWSWYVGFLFCLSISMLLLVKVTKELPNAWHVQFTVYGRTNQ
jgi:quaternary ammonium compound-resistance protein SugE